MSILDKLDRVPEPWKPEVGDKLVGEVIELDTRDSGFGEYPLVGVLTEDGREVTWHAFHTVAKSELARKRPKVGDLIGVVYQGKLNGKDYESYRIVVESREPTEATVPDWDAIAADAGAESAPAEQAAVREDLF